MDTGIMLVAAVVAFVVGVTVSLLVLRSKLSQPDYARLMAWAAAIRVACGNVLDEQTIRTLAGYAWDAMDGDMSKYFTRDEFIALILRALKAEPETAAMLAIKQARSGR